MRDALSCERARVTGLQPADPEAVDAATWLDVVEELPWRRAAALRRAFDREHVGAAASWPRPSAGGSSA